MHILLYLDPGTGSLLLYALIGIGATLIFSLRGLWYKIKTLFSGQSGLKHELPSLVFHSEGGKYWQVFQPIIAALDKRGVSCAYITPDPEDPALTAPYTHLSALHPGNEMITLAYMNHIKTDVVVSTTPHLDIYMLKRSRHVSRYVHVFHAPTDISFYEKYAFDYYDDMLTTGPFQEPSIRSLEKKRGTKKKALYPTGNCYFDYQKEELEKFRADSQKILQADLDNQKAPVVLYAPSWGVRSSLVMYGASLMEQLLDGGYSVIFRPHPQSWVSHKELMEEIKESLKDRENLEWDTRRTAMESMERSRIMLTDLSGVLFDFAFLFEKPVMLMNAHVSKGGFESEDLDSEWSVPASRALSRVIEEEESQNLAAITASVLKNQGSLSEEIKKYRDREIYNFTKAGEAAADNIVTILEKVKGENIS